MKINKDSLSARVSNIVREKGISAKPSIRGIFLIVS